jgi:hypothetical protein
MRRASPAAKGIANTKALLKKQFVGRQLAAAQGMLSMLQLRCHGAHQCFELCAKKQQSLMGTLCQVTTRVAVKAILVYAVLLSSDVCNLRKKKKCLQGLKSVKGSRIRHQQSSTDAGTVQLHCY